MIRLWYDQNGALLGTPWKVQIGDTVPFFAAVVEFNGSVRTVYRKDEAPHGIVEADMAHADVWADGKELK